MVQSINYHLLFLLILLYMDTLYFYLFLYNKYCKATTDERESSNVKSSYPSNKSTSGDILKEFLFKSKNYFIVEFNALFAFINFTSLCPAF